MMQNTEAAPVNANQTSAPAVSAKTEAQRTKEEAQAALAEAQKIREEAEAIKAQAEAEQNADITLVDALPGTTAGYGFGDATATPEATATPVPEATLPPTNP